MRGVYTAGVLRLFMDKGLYFSYVIGVSMGACNAANYISRQPERNKIVNIRYVKDYRFLSYRRLFFKGELFGMDFLFDTIPNSLVPFDMQTFLESEQVCITTVTDCGTGDAVYYEKRDLGADYLTVLRASASIPFAASPVHYKGRVLMDGGISDPIPILKSIKDGNTKNVIILTQPRDYRKKYSFFTRLVHLRYYKYPDFCKKFERRYALYNETLDAIDLLEKQNQVFVIRPGRDKAVGRTERDKEKLYALYDQGFSDASGCYDDLCLYLESPVS
ncbi:MAG: patatin family protein [Candidatus Marinimicrobia bacterium]|nr:patatin family protein [Candidatus Neomarinimicrobiota bacterium]